MNSIRLRLLLVSFIILLAFVLITGFALQKANSATALQAQQERMQGLVYALMGAIEIDNGNFVLNEYEVPEPRLSSPESGLFASIADRTGKVVWQSTSALNDLEQQAVTAPGSWQFDASETGGLFSLSFGFRWLAEAGAQQYSVRIVEEMTPFLQRRAAFQRNLWLWLMVPAGLLLLIQLAVLAWVMRPLKRLAREVGEIESGEDNRIDGEYPAELHSLQGALNTLLNQEHSRQQKYRQALDDLAHSLKTPLAVIRNLVHGRDESGLASEVAEQSDRMEQIVSRQLKRAAVRSKGLLAAPVSLREPLEAVIRSMVKVHARRNIDFSLSMEDETAVRIDRAELFELLGNLLDNAGKWATKRVETEVQVKDGRLLVRIIDDGPGFPDEAIRLLERGMRADTSLEGQGIGLAMAAGIAQSAGGSLSIDEESSGGCVILQLPSA